MTTTKPGCLPKFLHFLAPGRRPADKITHYTLEPDPEPEPVPLPYRVRDDFLSPAEASFYHVLKAVVGERLLVCPKVSLDDIFFVAHPEQNYAYFNKINRKHVDFLLCRPSTLKPVLGIELDDASHRRADRVERDEFVDEVFAAAGLPLLRIPARQTYSPQDLTTQIRGVLVGADVGVGPAASAQPLAAPPSPSTASSSMERGDGGVRSSVFTPDNPPFCPKCGVRMVLRTARRGEAAGRQFYGCPNYPQCREIQAVK